MRSFVSKWLSRQSAVPCVLVSQASYASLLPTEHPGDGTMSGSAAAK